MNMLARFMRLFAAPVFEDDEQTRLAGLLTVLLRTVLVSTAVLTPVVALLSQASGQLPRLLIGAAQLAAGLGLVILTRRGHVWLAAVLLPAGLLVILTVGLYNFGGLHSPSAAAYLLIIVLAALLLVGRGAIIFALLNILAALGVLYAEAAGGIVVSRAASGLKAWTIYSALYIIGALLLSLAARSIRQGLASARRLRAAEEAGARDLDAHLAVERKRVRQLELLAEIAGHLTGLKDTQTLMDDVVQRVHEHFDFEQISILVVEAGELVERATRGTFSSLIAPGERVTPGHGIIGWAGQTGRTYLTNNALADEHFVSLPGADVYAELAVPLRLGKSVIGVLNIDSEKAGAFDPADVSTLETLADLLSAAMQSSQLFAEVRARQRLAEALRRAGAAVTASLDLPTVLQAICSETCAAFDTDGAVVWGTARCSCCRSSPANRSLA